jgi:hypothetical protein
MRRGTALLGALALAAACSPEDEPRRATELAPQPSPAEPLAAPATAPAAVPASTGAAGDAVSFTIVLSDLVGDYDPDDEPSRPPLARRALALLDTWTEPLELERDGVTSWTWQDSTGGWELRVRGLPTVSDDDATIEWVSENEAFTLEVPDEEGESFITATCMSDGHAPQLAGSLHGRPALPEALAEELAALLPAVVAYTGLVADHRIEVAVMDGGLRAGLKEVARLTSSTAAIEGYRTLMRESDEPTHGELAALLRQAARQLDGDGAMHELIGTVLDVSFDDRAVAVPLLDAAATIQDDDLLAALLERLLDVSDTIAPSTLAKVLRTATAGIARDEPMALVLEAATWHAMANEGVRAEWNAALATVDADAPYAQLVGSVLAFGNDVLPEQSLYVLASLAQQVETESLRAQALAEVHTSAFDDARVADAYLAALANFEDANVLTDLLVGLLQRHDVTPTLSARWLAAATSLPRDDRLSSVLRAVARKHLSDVSVKERFLALATTLASRDDRTELLRLPPADPPAPTDAPR